MITLKDCVGLCGLTEEEVLAIAEHEHLPEIVATSLGQYLLSQQHGSEKIRDMIVDDIRQAQLIRGNKEHIFSPRGQTAQSSLAHGSEVSVQMGT